MKAVLKIVKGTLVGLIFAVIAVIILRIWAQSYCPPQMKRLVLTERLADYYRDGGEVMAYTQKIRVAYDDPKEGNFFASELIVVPDAEAMQVTVRYNDSTLERLAGRYGEAMPAAGADTFIYLLFCCTGEGEGEEIAGTTYTEFGIECRDFLMYHYARLTFDGVSQEGVYWMRLDIYREGTEVPEGSIVIYENHERYQEFKPYTGEVELP